MSVASLMNTTVLDTVASCLKVTVTSASNLRDFGHLLSALVLSFSTCQVGMQTNDNTDLQSLI